MGNKRLINVSLVSDVLINICISYQFSGSSCVSCQLSNILVLNLFLGTYILHIQGQRGPSKTIGAGVPAAQHWNDFEEIPHIQGQRRSPSRTVGGAKSSLDSNPIPTRDAQRAQTNRVCTRTRGPTETETELCLSISCGGIGQQWTAAGAGALSAADLGMA